MGGCRQDWPKNDEVQPELCRANQVGSAVAGSGDALEIRPPIDLPELCRRQVKAASANRTGKCLVVVDQYAGLVIAAGERHHRARERLSLLRAQGLVAHLQQP